MPVRSLTSPVLKWPDQKKVLQALKHWVENLVKTRCDIVQIGYFGSYARGDWGVGSDLDLVIIVDQTDKPFELRSAEFDTLELPIPTDVLVYTLEEWYLLKIRRPFFLRLSEDIKWIYHYKLGFNVEIAVDIINNNNYELEFEDKIHLQSFLTLIKFSHLPTRTAGRKAFHRENWTIFKYFEILIHGNNIIFPFFLIKSDRPDFILKCDDEEIGIEVTEANDEGHQAACTLSEELSCRGIRPIIHLSHYKPPKTKEWKKGIKKVGEFSDAPGWLTGEQENQWREYILQSINKKLEDINKKEYQLTDELILLIYDQTPCSIAINYSRAIQGIDSLIKELIVINKFNKEFDKIVILDNNMIISDIKGKANIIFHKLNNKKAYS